MKKIFVILLTFAAGFQVYAQSRIAGTVKDAKGVAIIGAAVVLESNSGMGSITDIDGKFSITVPSGNQSLVASCIGYKSQTVPVENGKNVYAIVLEEDSALLDEVVVVGYGSMKRSDLTGSVSSVKIDEDEAARTTSLDEMIQGHAAGVQVVNNSASPDAGISVRIRGLSSFTSGSSDPLYVVDGIIINGNSFSESVMSNGGLDNNSSDENNGLLGISPQDIANIEILKDASATAIYGSQGANGVVLITTRMASKEKPAISFNAGVDVSNRYKKIDMLGFDEFRNYYEECSGSPFDMTDITPVDWQDYMLRTAVSQRYFFSISGKPKSTSYLFSTGYQKKQGIVKNTDVQQFTARLNLDRNVTKNFKIGTRTSIAWISSSLAQGANASRAGAAASMLRSMLSYHPYISNWDDDTDPEDEGDNNVSSPAKWLKDFESVRKEFRVTPSLYGEWKIVPWLTFKSTLGADYRGYDMDRWKSRSISRDNGSTGSALRAEQLNWNWDNMLMVNKKFGRHRISGTIGSATSASYKSFIRSEGWQIYQDRAHLDAINSAVTPYTDMDYNKTASSLQSFLVRAIYNYRERYVVTATYRLDGSSKFQGANKWANFPSFAFAWRPTSEEWFKSSVVSSMKVRAGWGMVGNQAIAPYKTLNTHATGTIPDHSEGNDAYSLVTIYPNILANPDLKWETTMQFDAGFDLSLWKGCFTLTADFYNKDTRDLLQTINIAKSAGYSTMAVNSGSIRNMGFELTLEGIPFHNRDIEWTIGGNFSLNRGWITNIGQYNNIGTLYLGEKDADGKYVGTTKNYFEGNKLRATSSSAGILNYFIEGMPMGLFYGFKADGIAQFDGDGVPIGETGTVKAGDQKYVDINGNGYIDDDDRTIIGDPNPDFIYGFNTKLRWKSLSINIGFTGSFGNDVYNLNSWNDSRLVVNKQSPHNVLSEAYRNAWSVENPGGNSPRLGFDISDRYSDRFVEDASYLRLSDVSVSYSIKLKNKKSPLKNINIGVSGKNLYVFTKYTGWDPDVNSFGSDILRMGVDMGSYPSARTFSLDVKLKF